MPSTKPTAVSARTAELTLLVIAIAVSFPIRAYYQHRFGRVPALPWRSGVVPLIGQCVLLAGAEVVREWAGWQFPVTWAGVLTTASDVAFTGGREGYFVALDARTGDLLWKSHWAARSTADRRHTRSAGSSTSR